MALTRRATALGATICMGLAQLAWAPAAPAAEVLAAVSGVQNQVQFRGASAPAWSPAAIGRPIAAGDSIQTGPLSKAEITYQDGTVIRLASSSTLTMMNQERRTLKLLLGKLWAKVTKRGRGMSVHTPAAIASITGTEFFLEVMPDQSTHLTVVEGTVLMFPLRGGPGAPGGGADQGGQGDKGGQGDQPSQAQPGETVTVSGNKDKPGPRGQGNREAAPPGERTAAAPPDGPPAGGPPGNGPPDRGGPPPGPRPDPGAAPPPGSDRGPRPQLDMGGFRGNGPDSPPPMEPVSVSAGQGLIARPQAPLKQAFTVDTRLVRVQEAPLTGAPLGRERGIDPGVRGNDVAGRRELRNDPGNIGPQQIDKPGKQRHDPGGTGTTVNQGGPVAAGGPTDQGGRRGDVRNDGPVTPPQQGTPPVKTKTPLDNQRIDPKNLGGSPTTGTLQIIVR